MAGWLQSKVAQTAGLVPPEPNLTLPLITSWSCPLMKGILCPQFSTLAERFVRTFFAPLFPGGMVYAYFARTASSHTMRLCTRKRKTAWAAWAVTLLAETSASFICRSRPKPVQRKVALKASRSVSMPVFLACHLGGIPFHSGARGPKQI